MHVKQDRHCPEHETLVFSLFRCGGHLLLQNVREESGANFVHIWIYNDIFGKWIITFAFTHVWNTSASETDRASHNHSQECACMTFSVVIVRDKVRLLIYFIEDSLYEYAVNHWKAHTSVGPWKKVATKLGRGGVWLMVCYSTEKEWLRMWGVSSRLSLNSTTQCDEVIQDQKITLSACVCHKLKLQLEFTTD